MPESTKACNILLSHSTSNVGSASIRAFPFCSCSKLNKSLEVTLSINNNLLYLDLNYLPYLFYQHYLKIKNYNLRYDDSEYNKDILFLNDNNVYFS